MEAEAGTVISVRQHRLSEEHCQQARQREAENKHRPVPGVKTKKSVRSRLARHGVSLLNFSIKKICPLLDARAFALGFEFEILLCTG